MIKNCGSCDYYSDVHLRVYPGVTCCLPDVSFPLQLHALHVPELQTAWRTFFYKMGWAVKHSSQSIITEKILDTIPEFLLLLSFASSHKIISLVTNYFKTVFSKNTNKKLHKIIFNVCEQMTPVTKQANKYMKS